MDTHVRLSEVERLLLMAAAVHGLGPATDLSRANTARVVDQVLRWRGLSAEEVRAGWQEQECGPIHEEVYSALIRMVHQSYGARPPVRTSERSGVPLFTGHGNWGVPGYSSGPACWPQYNSCRLTAEGERIARELLGNHPEYRKGAEADPVLDGPDG